MDGQSLRKFSQPSVCWSDKFEGLVYRNYQRRTDSATKYKLSIESDTACEYWFDLFLFLTFTFSSWGRRMTDLERYAACAVH